MLKDSFSHIESRNLSIVLTDSFSQTLISHGRAGFTLTLIYQLSNLRSTQKLRPFEILALYNGVIWAPSYPSLSDLSIADLSSFKSLTAQNLMAGLSFNSIDTLLEVNAAAEARSKLNESTETVDFGII